MKSPCGNLISWGISPDFSGLSPCYRQIAYALLTRAPVAAKSIATLALPLDLHVLGLSLAFILSQDQTLRCIALFFSLYLRRSPGRNRRSLSIVLHLLLSNIFNELRPSPNTGRPGVLSKSDAKVGLFYIPLQIFYALFYAIKHTFLTTTPFSPRYNQTFFSKNFRSCHIHLWQGRKKQDKQSFNRQVCSHTGLRYPKPLRCAEAGCT